MIMQTIRICKMRIISTQFFTSYIHLLHKPVVIMSGIFTDICPDCGIREALEAAGLGDRQEAILHNIHQHD